MTQPPEESAAPTGLTASSLQQRAVQGAFWTAVNTVLSVPVAFVANAVVARYLGVEDYGRLAFLTFAVGLAVQLTNLGVTDAVVRYGAGYHARAAQKSVFDLLAKSLGFHLLVQLPLLLVTVLLLARGQGPVILTVLVLSVALPVALGSAALILSIENRTAAGAKLSMVMGLVTQTAVAGVAVATAQPAAVWAARSIAGAVMLPLNFMLLDYVRRRAAVRVRVPRDLPAGFWKYATYSCAAGAVALLVFSRSEILVLQAFGALAAAGTFALAFGLSQQLTAPADALLGPLLPAVSGLYALDPGRSRVALLRATRFSSLISGILLGMGVPCVYFLIPPIYGEDFAAAAVAFVPLAIVSCLQSVSHPVNVFTRARGQNSLLLRAYSYALAVDVLIAAVTIPVLGLVGAVIANAVSQTLAILLIARVELPALSVTTPDYLRACAFFGASIPVGLATIVLAQTFAPVHAAFRVAAAFGVGLVLTRALAMSASLRLDPVDTANVLQALPAKVRRILSFGLAALGQR